jgi:hypothetical protein
MLRMPKSTGRFTRKKEDFTCEVCGTAVKGNGYTDHCPNCLWSKHVDKNPGDRASKCNGLMKPVIAEYLKGEYILDYECAKCKVRKSVTAAADDNSELLINLSTKEV